jgi:hypothetical protein
MGFPVTSSLIPSGLCSAVNLSLCSYLTILFELGHSLYPISPFSVFLHNTYSVHQAMYFACLIVDGLLPLECRAGVFI